LKGLLLAGGHGTRLRPLTFTGNKHMLPIANKPMLLYGLEHLRNAGIKEIGVILGPVREGITEILGDGSKFGLKLTYIEQKEPLGLAHAVKVSRSFLDEEEFVMYLGDNLLQQGAKPLIEHFYEQKCDCAVAVATVNEPERYGIVEIKDGTIIRLVEKPRQFVSNRALVGVYVFNSSIFKAIQQISPSWRNELEITDAIQKLLDMKKKVCYQEVKGWWKDTGRPEDLLEANRLVLSNIRNRIDGRVDADCQVMGDVVIGIGSRVLGNSRISGPAIIGENCKIGPGTYIGPYTSIGDNSELVGTEIENSIVMENCKVMLDKRIVDSLIGRNATVVKRNGLPHAFKFVVGERTVVEA
jgi:glucose-1-phosphate thymidylyltransferase